MQVSVSQIYSTRGGEVEMIVVQQMKPLQPRSPLLRGEFPFELPSYYSLSDQIGSEKLSLLVERVYQKGLRCRSTSRHINISPFQL